MAARHTTPPAPAPTGVWLVTGTPTDQRYPCRCGRNGCNRYCPCAGRPDAADMHTGCCARRAHDTRQRQSKEDT